MLIPRQGLRHNVCAELCGLLVSWSDRLVSYDQTTKVVTGKACFWLKELDYKHNYFTLHSTDYLLRHRLRYLLRHRLRHQLRSSL